MIDVKTDELLTFAELARRLPSRRNGRPVAVSSVHRWRLKGLHGVRLEAIKLGGCWVTSWQAFQRWCEAVTNASSGLAGRPPLNAEAGANQSLVDSGW